MIEYMEFWLAKDLVECLGAVAVVGGCVLLFAGAELVSRFRRKK